MCVHMFYVYIWIERALETHRHKYIYKHQCFERAVQSIWEICCCCCCCCCFIPRNIYKQSSSVQVWEWAYYNHIGYYENKIRRKMRDVEQWLTTFSCFDFSWCLLLYCCCAKCWLAAAATATVQLLLRSMRIVRMSHNFRVYKRLSPRPLYLARLLAPPLSGSQPL